MKHFFVVCFCFLLYFPILGQTPSRYQITGTVLDTASAPLASATIMLLQRKDSSLVNFSRTDAKGVFTLRNVRKGEYLVKITYVGFIPYNKDIEFGDREIIDLGSMPLKPITKELFEVIIKTARAPMSIRGDTIEYDARTFKVPPGATVEDLLRRLPGVQVDANGNIIAQGQQVRKVTVDGKRFFGDDPKMATKNLPAEAVQKVQIFNDQSEQAKVTGVDDGKKEKTVNLELKEGFKKGGFGKLTAGVGMDGNSDRSARTELKGNYNKFDDKNQFSLIGLGNNTNQTGMSWDDFQDFRGSGSFNQWNDNGDFGFGGGVRISYAGDNDDGGLEIPAGGGRGQGYSNNIAGGINYNYNTQKTKLNSSYYYNSTRLVLDALRSRENFLQNGSFRTLDESSQINFVGNHRLSFRYEQTLDSLNTLIFTNNSRLNAGNTRLNSFQQFFRNNNFKSNETTLDNRTNINKIETANTLIYRLKFKKKGRNFAASASYGYSHNDGTADQNSLNLFYNSASANDFIRLALNLTNTTESQVNEVKSSLLFIEPLSKRIFWENFLNVGLRRNFVDRDAFDLGRDAGRPVGVDSLSSYFRNDITYTRLGSGLRYSYKGLNFSSGLAVQRFNLNGQFSFGVFNPGSAGSLNTIFDINRNFVAWLPNASLSIDLKNNRYLWSEYNVNVTQPNLRDLQPVIDNSNPLFVRQGNPDLLPSVAHNVFVGYNYFNPASFTNFGGNLFYTYNVNQVIYNQEIDPRTLVTVTKPTNITGGQTMGVWMNFGFPLKKTKSNLNLNFNPFFSQNLTFINGVLNQNNNENYRFGLRLDLTPSDVFVFYANANWGITNSRFSVNTAQNMRILNHTYSGTMNIKLPKDFFINANLDYRIFVNNRFNLDQRLPIMNTSIYKVLGKAKKAEIRLSVYDVFNRNLGVSQFANQNFVSQEKIQTLARYGMLSFTYNMRGVNTTLKRRGGFW
ncbi:MAG: outer membrane beta-barrel protein [Runella sp.]